MLDFKPFQTVKISTVISYKYLKSLFFYSYFPIPPQQTHEAAYGWRRRSADWYNTRAAAFGLVLINDAILIKSQNLLMSFLFPLLRAA